MKIVVTGGAGFIGSNFIRYMRSAHPEHKILCLDKLTYAGSLDNLTGILGSPDFMFSKTDIADEKAVNEALKSFMPEVIVNFAAESHVDRSI
ncbi:MAG: GDP-mannose 4,6-dehydratase, partial [Firmicutes bacterium]|nr:GDP-mannose 4,6-dehydratase [Candidatus Stercoripulliclostridium pullicola]